jgi:hypothetical protein
MNSKLLPIHPFSLASIVGITLVLAGAVYVAVRRSVSLQLPPSISVSVCPDTSPATYRVGSKSTGAFPGIQFNVPESNFAVQSHARDMPPETVYLVVSHAGNASMELAKGGRVTFEKDVDSSFPVFSAHVGERDVRTSAGLVIGKDHWGYLKNGDRWRSVRFFSGDEAAYRPLNPSDAKLMDEIIDTACIDRPQS